MIKLGKNPFGETVFEDEHGLRYAFSSTGLVKEKNNKSLRFLRLSSKNDADIFMNSMGYEDIFSSFHSIESAVSICSSKIGVKTNLNPIKNKNYETLLSGIRGQLAFNCFKNFNWNSLLGDWQYYSGLAGSSGMTIGFESFVYKSMNVKPECYTNLVDKTKKLIQKGNSSKIIDVNGSIVYSSSKILPKVIDVNKVKIDFNVSKIFSEKYISFSNPEESSGFAHPLLNAAYDTQRPDHTPEECKNIISHKTGISIDRLDETLSPEQIDSVFLALKRLENSKSFMVCDETGYGKGRILAAIAAAAIKQNINILFITEKKSLFKDFYRDVSFVFNLEKPLINIFHSGLSLKNLKVLINDGAVITQSINNDMKWIWTTYSQFNRKESDKSKNIIDWVSSKKTWVLFDETQNASGSSRTNDFAKKIESASSGCVFASATFAKNEDQLSLYKKMFNIKEKDWPRVYSGFSSDSSSLRLAMTVDLASKGAFMRREHPPVSPPSIIICKDNERLNQKELISDFWREIKDAMTEWHILTDGASPQPWLKIGEPMARCLREASMIEKIPDLVEIIKKDFQSNKKTVIVSDWTLSSHADDAQELELPSDGLWKSGWLSRVLELFDDKFLSYVSKDKREKMIKKLDSVKSSAARLPDWTASPFDELIYKAKKIGVKIEEISGRQQNLLFLDDGSVSFSKRKAEDRVTVIDNFNSGLTDVLLITRAANSGASMHSSKTFKDQRQRHMIEWDVSQDPSVRVQFWGRVRRKDQVCEPLVETLLLDTPSEIRRASKDSDKHNRLKSHSGSIIKEFQVSWSSEAHQEALSVWAKSRPHLASELGFYNNSDPLKILARSSILKSEESKEMIDFVSSSASLNHCWHKNDCAIWLKESRVVRTEWWFSKGNDEVVWNERVWSHDKGLNFKEIKKLILDYKDGVFDDISNVLGKWEKAKIDALKIGVNSISLDDYIYDGLSKNQTLWQQGSSISILDPDTKQRRVAIILGYSTPDSITVRCPHVISVSIIISGRDEPIDMSLYSVFEYGKAKPMPRAINTSDFSEVNTVNALVLEGPAWSIASWGSRVPVKGSLITMPGSASQSWGWVMPSYWSWENMLEFPMEVPDIKHAIKISTELSEKIIWMSGNGVEAESISVPQGFLFQSRIRSFFKPIENVSRGSIRPDWSNKNKCYEVVVPWNILFRVSASLTSSGRMMCANHSIKKWLADNKT